ncbi:ABC transporter substrate-binding protein [Streptomyces sp. LHD-70]|uniref:ABC transporter substrate-binding protein n=1 Tax=Streptomyces sp. LHD-70 TaxID=3072140 RepID=UPI00280F6BB2|nr:ABC transporter substrate-binding protein [Streptomyces sp. LHD-70]MDQ8705540.1 ABC transporter substrate-binding protein [Streptomyces sp. LHD-70]
MTPVSLRYVAAVLVATSVTVLTACGYQPAGAGTPPTPESGAASRLVEEAGVLRVGTNVPFVPMEFYAPDGSTLSGIDIDLARAVARRLGLRASFSNSSWDGLIPALNAGRHDMLASSFGDFPERRKQVIFVDMLKGGIAGIVRAADKAHFPKPSALCGKRVGVANGSATVAVAKTVSKRCVKDGGQAVSTQIFPTDREATVAIRSGRVDVALVDSVVAQHLAGSQPRHYAEVFDDVAPDFLYGFAVDRNNPALAQAIAEALDSLIADGTYARICAKYGITGSALVTRATINGGKQ